MLKRLKHTLLLTLLVFSALWVAGQPAVPDTVCVGTIKKYWVTGSPGSTYTWRINGVIQPSVIDTLNVTWNTPWDPSAIPYVVTVQEQNLQGCVGEIMSSEVVVRESLTVEVTIVASANPVCLGAEVTFTATPVNGGTGPGFAWFVNGIEMQNGLSPTFMYTPANNDDVWVVLTSSEACALAPATSNTIRMVVDPLLAVSVTIDASATEVCDGTEITLTATPLNGGTNPVFSWFVNGGVSVQSGPLNTYTYTPANGDQVYVELNSDAACSTGNPAVSNTIDIIVNPLLTPSVLIVGDANDVCAGTEVNFTATPVNGGVSPVFDWYVDGVLVQTGPVSTYAYAPVNGNVVQAVLTSTATCTTTNTANSNTISMNVNQPQIVSLSISPDINPVCEGSEITFTASGSNTGLNPAWSWFVDGAVVPGETASTYTFTPVNGNQVQAVVLSDQDCVSGNPASSNIFTVDVSAQLAVDVSIAAGANPVCTGTPVLFLASPDNGGLNPTYAWYVNGALVPGEITGVYTYTPADGDLVYAILDSEESCTTNDPATSNTIEMTVDEIPTLAATGNDPLSCGEDGSITFTFTNVPDGTYDIDYATGTFPNVTVTTGSATVIAPANFYENLTITVGTCTSLEDVDITIIELFAPLIDDVVITSEICGNSDGTITITASGGTGILEYSIDGGTTWQPANAFTGLAAGTYNVAVRDENLCVTNWAANPVTIISINGAAIDDVVATGEICGNSDGTITITASGGTGILEFSIDGGTTWQPANAFTGLAAGTYNVAVRDENLCVTNWAANPVTIISINGAAIDDVVATGENCGNSDGTITITASGGTGILEFSIDGGTTWQPANAFTGLAAGTYNVAVRDENLCVTTWAANPVTINSINGAAIDDVVATGENCGNSDGTITITASGGTGILEFSIDGGTTWQPANAFTGLAAGTYNVAVRDENLCVTNLGCKPCHHQQHQRCCHRRCGGYR